MRTITLALVGGLVTALAAAVAASAQPGTMTASATPARPAVSLPYRNGFRGADDAAGDAEIDQRTGAGAADITRFTISNNRAGFVVFAVTINQNSLFQGDYVLIFLDLDRNQQTGCDGDEVVFRSVGRGDAGAPVFELYQCRNGQLTAVSNSTYQGQFDAPDRRVLFGIAIRALGVNRFNALAMTVWVPDEQNSFRDLTPDSQYLSYTMAQVPCNEFIRPRSKVTFTIWATPSGRAFRYSQIGVQGVPAGAVAAIRVGSAGVVIRANASGVAASGRFRRRFVRPGTAVTVRVSAEGCAVTARFRVSRSGYLRRT